MNSFMNESHSSKSNSVKSSKSGSTRQTPAGFHNNRTEAITQRKLQAMANSSTSLIQRQGVEDEELLQGQFNTLQRNEMEEEELMQGKFEPVQRQKNNTGLPANLKSGMENLTGKSLDQVKVHYNSSKPSAVQAHAYAQGNDIHLANGQEKHLPHELGHVVQQMEGRVKPTTSVAGMSVNDNPSLETEATQMGETALQMMETETL